MDKQTLLKQQNKVKGQVPYQEVPECPERDNKILQLSASGYSVRKIGRMFHISHTRVHQIIKKARKEGYEPKNS